MPYKITDEITNFSHKVRVLFVKCVECDIQESMELLTIFFSNIDIVYDGEEALRYFNLKKYDLIVTGLNLPKLHGIELITRIRDVSKHITILPISSTTNIYDFTELIKLGIDGFIIRPLEIKQFTEVIYKTIDKLKNKEELYQYKINLEQKVQEQVDILRQKDKTLAYQSKLASMGEMIDAVAHQWKQPLNIINMRIDMLRYDYEDNNINKEYCEKLSSDIISQTSHMQNTLDEFRTFLRPDKQKKAFSIPLIIDKVLLLVKDEMLKYKIEIEKDIEENIEIDGIENEFKHLILNLISNSKDAFVENNIDNRKIRFKLYKNENKVILEISDNAGGIPKHIIDNIFEANVTSKSEGKGTGIVLYMSSQIIKKHNGGISVKNVENGSMFTVNIKYPYLY
ncbi:MAG: hybrid sensor histidine kinase/response regulator [Campylobacterota bacterium]|nr:hybrid sensor histidine kinase/response regulator [Campylobacterota bacterium]